MGKYNITAIVVVYNKLISESITCNKIRHSAQDIDVLIIDNSEIENDNETYCKENFFRYINMGGNSGLSRAYNTAIENSPNADVYILFDDDTDISDDYFVKLKEALYTHPEVDIFAPIIRGQDGIIYSPNEFHFLKNHFIEASDQEVLQELYNAIASCLAIRNRVFENYRFNETLFIDQVDQFFFCEQRNMGRKFMTINVEIQQNFYQRGAALSPQAGWSRLRLRIFDIFRHARLMSGRRYVFLALVKCCGLGVQIGKKCKSIKIMVDAMVLSFSLLWKAR